MSPEKLNPDEFDPWWYIFPGEQFTDTRGTTYKNKTDHPIPIRVHKTDAGLFIQAGSGNLFVDGVFDFSEIVVSSDG